MSTVARMNDMKAGLEDVYFRDSHVSTAEIGKCGETRPVQHCSKCGIAGHKANRCTGSKSSSYKQKFVNTDSLDPFCKVRDKDGDSDLRDLFFFLFSSITMLNY
jgi:hypothetical protein